MTEQILNPGEIVKFDECSRCGKVNPADVHTCSPQITFGTDSIASLKEKQRKEKAAKKKLPKNHRPQDH